MTTNAKERLTPGEFMLHPVTLASMAVLALNDHYLKATFNNWWTGKLSDFAGLVFFPPFLLSVLQFARWTLGREMRLTSRTILISIAATGLFFSAINLSTSWGAFYESTVSYIWSVPSGAPTCNATTVSHVVDPTDLIALVALVIPWKIAGDG